MVQMAESVGVRWICDFGLAIVSALPEVSVAMRRRFRHPLRVDTCVLVVVTLRMFYLP
jgi:hypothetical protein